MSQPELSIGQFSIAGRKEENEDSYGVMLPEGTLLETKGIAMVMADGMSASEAGKEASESCVKTFLTDYYSTHESLTVKTAVWQILSALNRWLYGMGQTKYASSKGMVSTFSGMVLKSATAHIFHVGDSRIYRLRGKTLEPLTKDHRVWAGQEKSYLSRAVGIDVNMEVDYRTETVEDGDIFVFTTDGLHEFLQNFEIVEGINRYLNNLDAAAEHVVNWAFKNGSDDNISCQIVRIDKVGTVDEKAHYRRLQDLPFPPALEPGMVLDGYKIQRELYASNRTQVYLAVDVDTDQKVVIKTPSVNYEDDAVFLELFIREEWVGRRLDSPHVLKVLKNKSKRNFLYTVTEYVEGQTLGQWMVDNPKPDIKEVRGLAEQIMMGLRAFHRKEMIHRDLKPDNILIDQYGTVKIIDFGSTKIAGLDEIISPVERTELLGTVDYTAPEYHLGQTGSKQADIYSLGAIVYEMLTGKLPYGQGFKNKRSIDRLDYIPANSIRNDIPDWVDGALQKACRRNPKSRYDLMTEFLRDLSQPNAEFDDRATAPLMERNPARFWQVLAIVSAILNVILLLKLLH